MAEANSYSAPLKKWHKTRNQLRKIILEKGFNKKLNGFVQAFDSEALDATSLLIPLMEFLPFNDPRIEGTIDATLKHLTSPEGLLYRYVSDDGLPGQEGTFILCSFWLVNVLALSGKRNQAEELFLKLLDYASPLGLFAEEVDSSTGELLGNFPQAFSHIGLINSALYLGKAKGRQPMGPEPLGNEA